MAWTYVTLSAAVQATLQNTEASFVANMGLFVQNAENRICGGSLLPMNRKNASIALTEGSVTGTLPSDFLAPFELRINNAGTFTPVDYVDVSYIREVFPNPLMTGVPRWYSVFNDGEFVMAPTPTVSLTAWLNYFYQPTSIVTAGTSWLGTNAEDCLLYGTLTEAYTYMKGDADLLKLYNDRFMESLSALRKLGEGMDLGDAYRMGEKRVPR